MKNSLRKLVVVAFCAMSSVVTINAFATESGTTADKPPTSGSTNGSSGPCREFPLCSEKFS